MKKTLVLFSLLSMHFLNAQIHEVGVFLGGSNFIGDVGKTDYVSPNQVDFYTNGIKARDILIEFPTCNRH